MITTATNLTVAQKPIIRRTTAIDAMFVAGPTIRKTSIAPGETPAASSTAARGVDEVAHTYSGSPIRIAPR